MDILARFQCLQPHVTATDCRRFSRMAWAMLVMTGRVTRLGLARWAGTGGRYRTVQRFFAQALPWAALFWAFVRQHLHCPDEVYRGAGDEVIVTKAGKSTHGLDRFLASLYGKPVPGLSFFTVSRVSVQKRRSLPLRVEPVVRSEAERAASKANAEAKKAKSPRDKRRPGRPQGSTNQKKVAVTFTPALGRIKAMLDALRQLMARVVPLTHLVLDGHFGHHNALAMARQCNVHLISTLRCDAALYFPDTGP
jgi:putative transposase